MSVDEEVQRKEADRAPCVMARSARAVAEPVRTLRRALCPLRRSPDRCAAHRMLCLPIRRSCYRTQNWPTFTPISLRSRRYLIRRARQSWTIRRSGIAMRLRRRRWRPDGKAYAEFEPATKQLTAGSWPPDHGPAAACRSPCEFCKLLSLLLSRGTVAPRRALISRISL
jgi:hypothetical protein